MNENKQRYSRRDFAKKAALISMAGPIATTPMASASEQSEMPGGQQISNLPANFPKLSDQSRAEAEQRHAAILAQYGSRFNNDQKADLRRLCYVLQPALDKVRAYTIQNGDSPALYLKPIVERQKKPAKTAPATTPAVKKP
ncbi:MAG: hypothetical protein JSS69_16095 [Acidobacteria bacterium]|nr:hypothetical protein [Acidobacteriota bacterium]